MWVEALLALLAVVALSLLAGVTLALALLAVLIPMRIVRAALDRHSRR